MGGRDSSSEAPKVEVGLNGFTPPKPVGWDLMGPITGIEGACEETVGLVGWEESKNEALELIAVATI